MAGDNNEEKYNRQIDRIISGRPQEDQADGELEFAAKIKQTQEKPSPEFRSALKSRLLNTLSEIEEEKTKPPSFFERLAGLARQRTWQAAGAALAVCVIALVVVWRAGGFSGPPVVTNPYPTVAVAAQATLNQYSYSPGEVVKIDFTFVNKSKETVTFSLPPALRIETLNADTIRSFNAGQVIVTLTPDTSTDFVMTWDQKDDNGIQIPNGEYQIVIPNVALGKAGFLSLSQSPTIIIQ